MPPSTLRVGISSTPARALRWARVMPATRSLMGAGIVSTGRLRSEWLVSTAGATFERSTLRGPCGRPAGELVGLWSLDMDGFADGGSGEARADAWED